MAKIETAVGKAQEGRDGKVVSKSSGIFHPATTSIVLPGRRMVMTGNFTKIEHGIQLDEALFRKAKGR
ncbi:MAG: hypothetical protein ACJAT6_001697 [Akkermansiaceae bacterium]